MKCGEMKLIQVKNLLDSVSSTSCVAKWKQVSLHLQNGKTHSCHHSPLHKIPADSVKNNYSALHNTQRKIDSRRLMLKGERPSDCKYCWNIEDMAASLGDAQLVSDRIRKSSESWALDHISELPVYSDSDAVLPSYVEVSFSNQCNFKCSYCSPMFSSRWVEEIDSKGPYPTSEAYGNLEWLRQNGDMPIHHSQFNPYQDAFWKWWPDLVKELKVLRITGGEPLLTKDLFKVVDYLAENPQPGLALYVNTNACVPDAIFDKFITRSKELLSNGCIRELHVYTSIDGWGGQAEYARHGLSVDVWRRNVVRILSEIPEVKIIVMCTANIFSVHSVKRLLEEVLAIKNQFPGFASGSRFVLDVNVLRYPHHLNLAILPLECNGALQECLEFMSENVIDHMNMREGFIDVEVSKMRSLVRYHEKGCDLDNDIDLHDARMDFYKFVREHDRRRSTDFLSTFPGFRKFYDECKELCESRAAEQANA